MSKLISNEQELKEYLKLNPKAVVLFYASWCPYSKRFLPIYEKQVSCSEKSCRRVVIDGLEYLTGKYSIKVYPTILFFENGKVTQRLDGIPHAGLSDKQLADFINVCKIPKD